MTNPACATAENAIFIDDILQTRTIRYIGVIGSRNLPITYKPKVKEAVKQLLEKGYAIASGGAIGADNYALESLLELGAANRGIIFSPWQFTSQFPLAVRENIKTFMRDGGKVIWGNTPPHAPYPAVASGLLSRNLRLVAGAAGLVAFPFGDSRGTSFSVRHAQQKNIPIRFFQIF